MLHKSKWLNCFKKIWKLNTVMRFNNERCKILHFIM